MTTSRLEGGAQLWNIIILRVEYMSHYQTTVAVSIHPTREAYQLTGMLDAAHPGLHAVMDMQ